MGETWINVTASQPIESEIAGITLQPAGANRGHGSSIQNIYRCAGPDDVDAVAVAGRRQWRALVELRADPPGEAEACRPVQAGESEPTRSTAGCRTGWPGSPWNRQWESAAMTSRPAPVVSRPW